MRKDGIYKVDGGYFVVKGGKKTYHYTLRGCAKRWGKNPPEAKFPWEPATGR